MALFPGKKDQGRRPSSGAATPGGGAAASSSRADGAPRPRPAAAARPASPGRPGRGKGGKKGKGVAKVTGAAGPLHERRRRLVSARETTLRDLGGLMLEMYKRNRFREELLLDKCEEVLAIEVEVAHIDQRLFQLSPPNAAGQRPIGRCECGAPILPGQNFCGVCGRAFATLTQNRSCERCGAGLRPGDGFCATCGTSAPEGGTAIDAGPAGHAHELQGPALTGGGNTDLAAPGGSITMLAEDGSELSAVLTADGNVAHAASLDTPSLEGDTTIIAPAAPAAMSAPAMAGAPAPGSPAAADLPALDAPAAAAASPATAPVAFPAAAEPAVQPAAPQPKAAPTEAEQKALAKAKAKRIAELKKAKAKAAKERAKARARDAKRGRGDDGA